MLVMNSLSKSHLTVFKILLLTLIALFNIFWLGNYSNPQAAFNSLLSAAATMDLDNFLDCCDLESMTGEQVTPQTKEQIKSSLKNDPYRREFIRKILNYLNNSFFLIIKETTISPEMKTLFIKNNKTGEQAQLLFRKRKGEWKLSSLREIKTEQ